MTEREAYTGLNLVRGMGPVTARALAERLGGVAGVFSAGIDELIEAGLSRERAESLHEALRRVDVAGEMERTEALGAWILTPADAAYPCALRGIHDPPLALYGRGRKAALEAPGVGVVGTRRPSLYGGETARRLAYQLAAAGMTVVSGLARGIDTEAHRGALRAGGVSVAVLGSALDRLYPAENRDLAEALAAEKGAVVSEFPLGRPADRTTFPMRNRVVSGLTAGTLVVEAPLASGAMITADIALEQGRAVMAVPGRIDTPLARGCHRLLRDGARLVECVEDVLEECSALLPESALRRPAGRDTPNSNDEKRSDTLNPEERRLLSCLGREESDIDALIRSSGLPAGKVSALLVGLEIKRQVRTLPGRRIKACSP